MAGVGNIFCNIKVRKVEIIPAINAKKIVFNGSFSITSRKRIVYIIKKDDIIAIIGLTKNKFSHNNFSY